LGIISVGEAKNGQDDENEDDDFAFGVHLEKPRFARPDWVFVVKLRKALNPKGIFLN
jgi:hypothetical protein